ncbi:TPA: PaaI family thioesterase, partial [Streptococcus suis]|nr:PaaI family thioesterase [Streptococcus suis]
MLDKLNLQPITVLDDYQATMLNEKEVLLTTKVTE